MLDKYSASVDRYGLLKLYARENRNNMTEAERVLWNHIRKEQLGIKFMRQYIIGDYIVDFVCRECGLVIEVDGAYHAELQQQEDDTIRQRNIEKLGFHFLRFSNEEILFDINHVINEIEKYFEC